MPLAVDLKILSHTSLPQWCKYRIFENLLANLLRCPWPIATYERNLSYYKGVLQYQQPWWPYYIQVPCTLPWHVSKVFYWWSQRIILLQQRQMAWQKTSSFVVLFFKNLLYPVTQKRFFFHDTIEVMEIYSSSSWYFVASDKGRKAMPAMKNIFDKYIEKSYLRHFQS